MRDILPILERWVAAGTPVALGSVIERVGSAPRDAGATIAIAASGEIAGSVTGGCVEPGVIREGREVLAGGTGKICRYGLNDAEGWDVGLSCGGSIAVGRVVSPDDGIDAVLLEVEGDACRVSGSHSEPYPDDLAARLRAAIEDPGTVGLDDLGRLDVEIGEAFARVVDAHLHDRGIGAQC